MINKLKSYIKSCNFRNDIFLSFLPFIILGIIFYSNNTHLVYWDTTIVNFLLNLSIISYFWILLWRKFGKGFLVYLPLGLILGILSLIIIPNIPNKVFYIWIFAFSFNFLLYKIKKIRPIFYIFCLFLLLSQILQGSYQKAKYTYAKQDFLENFDIKKYNQPIKNKLNVYYLLADAYSSFETFKTQDNIDNSQFLEELEKRNFFTNTNAYSNYPRTYTSMLSTFQMKHHYYKGLSSINSTELKNSKYIIAGFNPVMSRFYNNKYSVYITPYRTSKELQQKITPKKWNGTVKKKQDIELQKQDVFWLLSYLDRLMVDNYPGSAFTDITKSYIQSLPIVKISNQKIKYDESNKFIFSNIIFNIKDKNPKFVYAHNPTLVDGGICLKKGTKDYHYRQGTIDQLKCLNNDILLSVDHIIKNDPNAIIILQADHGCCAQKNEYGDGSGMIEENWFNTKYIEKNSEIQKKFGILLSVRWPKECEYLGREKYTPVNLFPRVFACLNGKKPNYKKLSPDDSYFIGGWYYSGNKDNYEVFKVIEKNVILPKYR